MPVSDSADQDRWQADEQTSTMRVPDVASNEPHSEDATPAEAEVGTLVIRRGPQEGARFPVRATSTTIGRDRACDVVLDDVTVSRTHAEIHHENRRFTVADAGSLNGTYVNRAATDRAVLSDGDEIWIGKFRLTFLAGTSTE